MFHVKHFKIHYQKGIIMLAEEIDPYAIVQVLDQLT